MIRGIIERARVQPGKTFAEFKLVVLLEGTEVVKDSVCTQEAVCCRTRFLEIRVQNAFEEKDLEMKATCAVHQEKKQNPGYLI